ncbi:MAG: hypothetical protein IJB81_03660, partial [Clostridia bacterium]|nr:hypothetical protein [Clostridia bacterium]
MRINGAMHWHRLAAWLLATALMLTSCLTPALAADVWDTFMLNVLWTDENGQTRSYPAADISQGAERAYWANVDAAALNQPLTVEALCDDPAYTFYLDDGWGNRGTSFLWLPEMNASTTGYEAAYQLYYDVDGVPGGAPVLLYVSTSAMPQETPEFQPFPVQVPVYYVTEDGTVLDSQIAECWAGETTDVWAASRATEGYAITGSERVQVKVNQQGVADPGEVTFVYRQVATPTPEPTEAPTPTPVAEVSVPVVYYHVNGEQLDFQELFLQPGNHVIQANSSKVSGYVPAGEQSVYITVFPDGTTDQGSVVFYYEDAAPAEAVIPVYYLHEDGTTLDMQELTLLEGNHVIQANSKKTEGLEPVGPTAAEVTVYPDGSASIASVQFVYKTPYVAPAEAVIPVYYLHEDGTTLDMQELTLPEGNHVIQANSKKTEGLEPVGPTAAEVTVYPDGSASIASVQFVYKTPYAAPAEAVIP